MTNKLLGRYQNRMKLSISCRIVESSKRKDLAAIPIEDFIPKIAKYGFKGISLRASAVSVDSTQDKIKIIKSLIDKYGIKVSMVMGNVDLAANNENASKCLRNIKPHLDLADSLNCSIVRVMIKYQEDIKYAQKSLDEAAERNIFLAQQTHWGTLCETIEQAKNLVKKINRKNFGITFEPANLIACGENLNLSKIECLLPHILNCYFQNIKIDSNGKHVFKTFAKGNVNLSYVPFNSNNGIDIKKIIKYFKNIDFGGWITIHQPLLTNQNVDDAIMEAKKFFTL